MKTIAWDIYQKPIKPRYRGEVLNIGRVYCRADLEPSKVIDLWAQQRSRLGYSVPDVSEVWTKPYPINVLDNYGN